jgi:hypothetical protein
MVMDLLDELIDHILTFLKERDIGRCRQVNRRLYQITNRLYLIKRFPHIYVDGSLYLKEQAYFTPALHDRILMTTTTNDLEWLVSRTTPIIREICNGDMMSWIMMIDAVQTSVLNSAQSAARAAAMMPTTARQSLGQYGQSSQWYACLQAGHSVNQAQAEDTGLKAVTNIIYINPSLDAFVEVEDAIDVHAKYGMCRGSPAAIMVSDMNITDPVLIGLKCYQIHECRVLLSINKDLLSKIKGITDTHLKDIKLSLPDDLLKDFKDNPWIKQYQDVISI